MKYKLLDVVVLRRNLPAKGLKRSDLGTIVEFYAPDEFEVEFVTASGETKALIPLRSRDVRAVAGNDLIAVRSLPGKSRKSGTPNRRLHPTADELTSRGG